MNASIDPATDRMPSRKLRHRGIKIRDAYVEEFSAIGKVTVSGFTARADIDVASMLPQEVIDSYRDAAGRAQDGTLLIAVDDVTGEIVGTASLLRPESRYRQYAQEGEAELRFVTVLPSYRGWGIAQDLVAEALRRAQADGVTSVILSAGERNIGSQRVYSRMGFVRTPAREGHQPQSRRKLFVFERRLVPQQDQDIEIRLVRADELEMVTDLIRRSYSAADVIDAEHFSDLLKVKERAHDHEVWVAVDPSAGGIVGTVTTPRCGEVLSPVAREGDMDVRALAVAPEYRRQGVGTKLLSHALVQAENRNAQWFVISAGAHMDGARALYEFMGFDRMPERESLPEIKGAELVVYGCPVVGTHQSTH